MCLCWPGFPLPWVYEAWRDIKPQQLPNGKRLDSLGTSLSSSPRTSLSPQTLFAALSWKQPKASMVPCSSLAMGYHGQPGHVPMTEVVVWHPSHMQEFGGAGLQELPRVIGGHAQLFSWSLSAHFGWLRPPCRPLQGLGIPRRQEQLWGCSRAELGVLLCLSRVDGVSLFGSICLIGEMGGGLNWNLMPSGKVHVSAEQESYRDLRWKTS